MKAINKEKFQEETRTFRRKIAETICTMFQKLQFRSNYEMKLFCGDLFFQLRRDMTEPKGHLSVDL